MTPEALWDRYAAIWSLDAANREAELVACLADDVTYCDPNGLIDGRPSLSSYMAGFQSSVPGGKFHIRSVLHHHDRTLAHWTLHGADDAMLQTGTSFGILSTDGRLQEISGFFGGSGEDRPA
jgi:hypothetical protein